MQHPDVAQFVERMECLRFVESILTKGPFCNSDKYSFLIAANDVLSRFPASMREVMMNNEASLGEMKIGENQTAAYLRRLYLMDIYRFFRLYPHRAELANPFDVTADEMGGCDFFSLSLLSDTPIEKYKVQIVRQLKKHQMNRAAQHLLQTFAASCRDMQYYLWTQDYDHALQLNPRHERALLGKGRQLYDQGRYEEALTWFEQLTDYYPEKTSNQLYVAICLVQLERYEEALKPLYRLNYEQPDNDAVNRVLAWTLTCQGKLEQAANIYEQLVGREQQKDDDLKNYGYCLWLQGRVGRASELFRQYHQRYQQGTVLQAAISCLKEWLKQVGEPSTELLPSCSNLVPRLFRHLEALLFVAPEHVVKLTGSPLVYDNSVFLKVTFQAACIQVGAANGAVLSVDHHNLGMVEAWHVQPDNSATLH